MSGQAGVLLREAAVDRDGGLPRFECAGILGHGVVAGITVRPVDMGLAGRSPAGVTVESWMRLARIAPGITGVVVSRQAHGAEVVVHRRTIPGIVILDGFDGHVTAETGQLLAVTVADCVPVYLSVPGRGVALLHAGWRGLAAGGLERAVEHLTAVTRTVPEDLLVHLGVSICGECYEVGPEVIHAVGAPAGRTVDLRSVLADRARTLGIRQISTSPWCSRHDEVFHSHRRDGVSAGRMVAYLGRRSLDSS